MSEKLFTQEEVNQIISERLKRVKTPSEPAPAPSENDSSNDAEKALKDREAALKRRENKILCSEYLDTMGISKEHREELLNTVSVDDVDGFKKTAEHMIHAFGLNQTVHGMTVANPPMHNEPDSIDTQLRNAFKLNNNRRG